VTKPALAPAAQRPVTADGSYATYQGDTLSETVENHLDEVTEVLDCYSAEELAALHETAQNFFI